MAVVKSDQFEAFFARPPRAKMFLLHGGDADVASERARRLAPALVDDVADPFQLTRLSADTLARDPGRLADEASAISMFGGKRVIWIEAGGRDFSSLIEPIADTLPADTSLLVEADNLKKGSPMRTLFETRPDAVAIECYAPPPASLAQMIETQARQAGIRLDPETRDHFVAALAAEPGTARGEIAKLLLYAHSAGVLEPADIDALVPGGASPADALVDLALSGELKALERAAVRGLADSGDAQLAAMRLAARILLMLDLRQGGAEPAALQRLPFAARRAVVAQANAIAPEMLTRRLPALLKLLVSTRRSPELASASAFRALTAFAMSARR